jgi:hypothetical protein
MKQTPSYPAPQDAPPPASGSLVRSKSYPSADLIRHTIRVWEPRLGRPLTEEDARQILENVIGFFRVLRDWDSKRCGRESEPTKDESDRP